MFCSRCSRQLLFAAIVVGLLPTIPCLADSQARIVRLSDVQGDVRIDRNTGQGFERAFLNLPITQGAKVRTGENGVAELEFEDGSSLRLTPHTAIAVTELSLRDSGAKLSAVQLEQGMAYVNFFGAADDEFDVAFAREKLALKHATHVRIALGDADAVVAVFKGEAEVVTPTGPVEVAKGHSASFNLSDDKHRLANDVNADPYDSWDKQQSQYQQQYSDKSYSNYSPYAYGTSDLNYYGNFWLRHALAALFRWGRLGPVDERCLGLFPRLWLRLGFWLSVGLDSLPLRHMELPAPLWVGLATRRCVDGVERLAHFPESSDQFCGPARSIDSGTKSHSGRSRPATHPERE